jgi:hypothetical protein
MGLIELDKTGQLNHIERKGLKGTIKRGMFNPHYNNVEFYKKQPGTRADVAMACFRRIR